MPNLVRVRSNGLEFNVGRSHAEANGLTVLDDDPYGADGRPKPTSREGGRKRKPKTSVAEAAEKKAAGSKSADQTEKEN